MERSLSVVVVTYNSAALLPRLAETLPVALGGFDHYEVVVVDSGSSDGTLVEAGRILDAPLLVDLGANLGYAAGINAGIRAGRLGGAVLVLNPDIEPTADSFAQLADSLARTGAGITVPRLVDDAGQTRWSLRRRPTIARALGEALLGRRAGLTPALGEVVQGEATYDVAQTVDWATGAVMCISRACIEQVGAWDESFFLYSEETDFSLRAADAGFPTRYEPSAVVMHVGGDAMVSTTLFSVLMVSRVRAYRKRHGRVATEAFRAALSTGLALRALRSPRHRAALRALYERPDAVVRRAQRGTPPAAA